MLDRINIFKKLSSQMKNWKIFFQFTQPIGFPLCANLFACKKDGDDGKDCFSNPQEHILSTLEDIIKDEKKGNIKIFLLLLLIHHLRNEPFNCKEPEKYWEVLCEMQIDKEMGIRKEQIYDMKADDFDCEKNLRNEKSRR